MKNSKPLILITILVVAIGISGFFGGMKYQQSKQPSRTDLQSFGQLRGGMRQPDTIGTQQREGSGMVRGEIISKDGESVTVKLLDDSSKIILISENTTINKTTEGSIDDLETGEQVVVFGQENSDKSISATNVQIDSGFREGMQGN